ncbi:MAG: S8 family serine peptidase [Lewinellaceae bacterium]|nr:S8 family serine peptidase [Lewinellaceae bacterium]
MLHKFVFILIFFIGFGNGVIFGQSISKIDPVLLNSVPDATLDFVVVLSEQAELKGLHPSMTKNEKARYVYETLLNSADHSQSEIKAFLSLNNIQYKSFYIVNAINAKGNLALIRQLAERDDVKQIIENGTFKILDTPPAIKDDSGTRSPLWNLTLIGAPSVWNMGFTGQGIVVGGQDTGYAWDISPLQSKYKGWNGTSADHNYNWHDAIYANNSHTTGTNPCGYNLSYPCDDNNHGTHTMGTMIGGLDNLGQEFGVAPNAKWIGCRNMERGYGTLTTYVECFEWFLAPYPYNSTPSNGDPDKMPHVINNSWGCPTSEGCNTSNFSTMEAALNNLRAAGCVIVVSAGNSGSACGTVNNPAAIFEGSFTVGATDSGDAIASFSSRGAVTVDNSNRLKPNISAPGVSIKSCITNGGFPSYSGTSMAGPHVAGAVALLLSANPTLEGNVDKIEEVFEQTALHITSTQICNGVSGVPNNVYGYGRIDVNAAVKISLLSSYEPIVKIDNDYQVATVAGGIILVSTQNQRYRVTVDDMGTIQTTPFSGTQNTVKVVGSSLFIDNPGKGIILRSPNGTHFRLRIGSNGELETQVTSPPLQNFSTSMTEDISIYSPTKGVILKDSNNACFLVNITTLGNIISIPSACP